MMTIRVVKNNPPRVLVEVKTYAPPFPFFRRLWKKLKEENIHAITIRSGIQLSEITMKILDIKDDQEEVDGATIEEKSAPISLDNEESTEASTTKAPRSQD